MVKKVWEQEASWSQCLDNQEADREQEVRTGYKTPRLFFNDLFPLARLHLLKVPQPSQIVPTARIPSVLTQKPMGDVGGISH